MDDIVLQNDSLGIANRRIAPIQVNMSRSKFEHGKPWNLKNKDVTGSSAAISISQASCVFIIRSDSLKFIPIKLKLLFHNLKKNYPILRYVRPLIIGSMALAQA